MKQRLAACVILSGLAGFAAAEPVRPTVVSLDYCADQYVLALADREQILAVSKDAERMFSLLREKAAGIPKVRAAAEDVVALAPDVVVRSWGGDARALALIMVSDWLAWLDEEEFQQASRGLVESRLRPEMLQLEQTVLLDTLDQSWKDHLYAMDQLRDGINYQAFAQQDPKIAYKKQGAELFKGMLTEVQERVAEYVYKARVNPAANMPAPPTQPRPQPAGAGAAGGGGGFFGSSIAGPGFASAPPKPAGGPPAGEPPAGQA